MDKNKFIVQKFAGNYIWGSTSIDSRTSLIIQNFLVDLFFIIDNNDVTRYADHNITYLSTDKNRWGYVS